jgi:hypothetical protein
MVENMRVAAHAQPSAKHKFQHAPAALAAIPVTPAREPLRLVATAEDIAAAARRGSLPAEPSPAFERAAAARAQLERMSARLTLAR